MLKFRYLTYSNFGPMAKWYEDMAKRGYQIEKILLPFIHKFKKSEPADIKYKISIAPNENLFSKFSKEELGDFDKMAKEYGWHLVDRSFNMNLYRVDIKGSDSLYNDDKEEIATLKKGIKGELITLIFTIVLAAILALLSTSRFNSSDIYYSNYAIFMTPAIYLLLILNLLTIVDYISFKRRNKSVEKMDDIKFTSLGFSKFISALALPSLILVILAPIVGLLPQITRNSGYLIVLYILVNILMLGLIYFSIKKVKLMNAKKSKKKILFALIPFIIFIGTSLANIRMINTLSEKTDLEVQDLGDFTLRKEGISLLSESCLDYRSEIYDLDVRKTVVKSDKLAVDLFKRILKNAKNHPYRSDFIKDISNKFPYDRTYSLAGEDSYLILQGDTVLEIEGNISDKKVRKEIEKILEAK